MIKKRGEPMGFDEEMFSFFNSKAETMGERGTFYSVKPHHGNEGEGYFVYEDKEETYWYFSDKEDAKAYFNNL